MALGTTNISVSLVRDEIGAGSNDVGTLCTYLNINKWSRWKPVSKAKITGLTDSDLQSVNFGLTPPSSSTNYASVVGVKWTYQRPTGGELSPYRIGDFRNYYNDAMAICQAPSEIKVNIQISNNFRSMLQVNIGGSDYQIGLNDFSGVLGSLYYCAVLVTSGGTWIVTADNTLANGGNYIDKLLPVQARLQGTTGTVYHVLSTNSVSSFTAIGSAPANTYYSLPSADWQSDTSAYEVVSSPILGDTDVTWGIRGISVSAAGILDNIDPYITIGGPSFETVGSVFLKYRIVNTGGSTGIFEGGNLYMESNPTYFGANTNKVKAYMYDTNGNAITSVVVQAGQTAYFVVGTTNLMNRNGTAIATPVYGTEVYSNIGIYKSVSGSYTFVTGIGLNFIAQ